MKPINLNKKITQATYLSIIIGLISLATLIFSKTADNQPSPTPQHITQELPNTLTPPANQASYWQDEEVQAGDDLPHLLTRIGIQSQDIQELIKQNPASLKSLTLKTGQIISIHMDTEQHLKGIQFFHDNNNGEYSLIAIQKANHQWITHSDEVATQTLASLRSVNITSSTSGALARAGVPIEIRIALKEIFSSKINLDQLSTGDNIRVLYETLYFHGQEVATGNILAAEITTQQQHYYAYYLEHNNQIGYYYDELGKPLKQGFSHQPIESYTRISSPYGIRIHPILGGIRMHTGIDYAAPTGTKIIAPSDGIVSFIGWKGGYGKTIMLLHANGIETLYGHMSDYVKSLHKGSVVRAGDIIGFVGSTGRSTGPHLHYEVRINGQHINPASITLPSIPLDKNGLLALQQYRQSIHSIFTIIDNLPVMVSQQD